jgi:trigger factor
MAENETDTAVQEQAAPEQAAPEQAAPDQAAPEQAAPSAPAHQIRVEDAGPGTKKITVEIPKEVVADRIAKQFKDLKAGTPIPGFRPGRVPEKLLQKRFGTDVRAGVRGELIRETYEEAMEKNSLKIIGEPQFTQKIDEIKVSEDQPLVYSVEVEVQPHVELPDLSSLKVRKPVIAVGEEHIQRAVDNLCQQQGLVVPVEGRGVQDKDILNVDIHIKVEGADIQHQHDVSLNAAPARIAGMMVADLSQRLAGANPGEMRAVTAKVPDDHSNHAIRGKDAQIEITIKDIKHLEPAEINEEFLEGLGFRDEQELRSALKEEMLHRVEADVARTMRQQVIDFLLAHTTVEIPGKLSDRQTERLVARRSVDLVMRGVSHAAVQANIEKLKTGAAQEAQRELKTHFVLQKLADDNQVEVSEAELNGRVAMIASARGTRPERLKQDMAQDGSLANLYVAMRDEKAIDLVLKKAQIEEYAAEPPAPTQGDEVAGDQEAAAPSDQGQAPQEQSPAT